MSKDKAEEKPYLQDLFGHMNNEHGLILTQSEMLEILSISGKEYDNVQFELGEIERQNSSLSTENAQLREALREMVDQIDEIGVNRAVDYANGSRYYRCMISDESYEKAKQLLTEIQK